MGSQEAACQKGRGLGSRVPGWKEERSVPAPRRPPQACFVLLLLTPRRLRRGQLTFTRRIIEE